MIRWIVIAVVIATVSGTCDMKPTHSVGWIGNSYTFYNDGVDNTYRQLANSLGFNVTTKSWTRGGRKLGEDRPAELTKLLQETFDYMVIQDFSLTPGYLPEGSDDVTATLKAFDDYYKPPIVQRNEKVMLYMTWGRFKGFPSVPFYPNYTTMQQRLRGGYEYYRDYLNKGVDPKSPFHAYISPVGLGWLTVFKEDPAPYTTKGNFFNLFQSDESHPMPFGTYLAACTFFAAITGKSPVGATWAPTGVSAEQRAYAQDIAKRVVLDDIYETGYVYPWAGCSDNKKERPVTSPRPEDNTAETSSPGATPSQDLVPDDEGKARSWPLGSAALTYAVFGGGAALLLLATVTAVVLCKRRRDKARAQAAFEDIYSVVMDTPRARNVRRADKHEPLLELENNVLVSKLLTVQDKEEGHFLFGATASPVHSPRNDGI